MSYAARLSLLCSLTLAAACGTIDDPPSADAGSKKDGGFVLVEDPPLPDGGRPGQDGGSPAPDGGSTDGGSTDGGAPDAGQADGGEPPPGCGDGELGAGEGCDDGNTGAGDGCSAACAVETGYGCTGEPSDCLELCGDGKTVGTEECDDGNTTPGDGCGPDCTVEPGSDCDGGPCPAVCGDGVVMAPETCDDGNSDPGDGCSAACKLELGFTCNSGGCQPTCGDGRVVGAEACDDGNVNDADGCSSLCELEPGYSCAGLPSVCQLACGDSKVKPPEQCDDGNGLAGDGCSDACTVEPGFTCAGEPSACAPSCGDGLAVGAETCDDGNTLAGDGCSATCRQESGFACDSNGCLPTCGDGLVLGAEECDDGNVNDADGCSSLCERETGYSCAGAPSACQGICGDGLLIPPELCDDGAKVPGDGCSATCTVEGGFSCTGEPSACETRCGDAIRAGSETCDDGNAVAEDGCDDACQVETGFTCTGTPRSTCASVCGDGITVGTEACDDGNATPNDGCADCKVDTGFGCTGQPSACATECGDGTVAGAEQCEPGAVSPLWPYGCSDACRKLGGVKVTLSGVAAGTTAELTGPGGYAATVVDGQQLGELAPGNYALDGAEAVLPGSIVGTFLDAPASLHVTVTGGQQAQATLSWTARGGTGSLWVGSALTQLLGVPDSTLGNPAASCLNNAGCPAGTACVTGNFCARSATVGGRSHLAAVALEDGTLVFGGSDGATPTSAPRITTYAPAALASSSPQPSKVLPAGPTQPLTTGLRVSWPGTAPTEFSALAAMPGGPVFAAAGDAVVQLPYPVGAGQAYVGLSGLGQVLALAVTADPATPGTEVLWVAFRNLQSTVVKGYTVGAGGFTEVADLAESSGATLPAAFGAQVELAVAPDGLALWMADGLPGTPNQVRLQRFTLSGVPNATLEASRTLFVSGYAAPTGLAVGDVDATEAVSPLLLADDAGKVFLLPASEVSEQGLANEGTFSSPAEWSVSAPSGLCFSPARP